MRPAQGAIRRRTSLSAVRRGALVALALAAIAALAIPTASRAQLTPDSSGFIQSADGARLYFAVHGSSRDTVIVPGGVLLANDLAVLRDNVTLVFYDPRGRGKSEWIADPKRLTMADELRDLEAVRAAFGISRAALVGFSYLASSPRSTPPSIPIASREWRCSGRWRQTR
jgi:hypothetical protein